ncbi:hypothetical protein ColLi_04283 [Colletotrichum liriopes]|uniref:Putative transcription factor kapC n=1 Tax=Colletotrichum liriopes TaxID=708192 RepID=A0AA37LQE9_9PEZI|nr:hypothetical protein ColLi_04283 [Colletotrichum liriopes]
MNNRSPEPPSNAMSSSCPLVAAGNPTHDLITTQFVSRTKRRAQNRANQRAYRKRKEQQLKELQLQIDDMSQKNDELFCACRLLADECYHLQANQMASGQPLARDSSGFESMALDIGALATHRVTPFRLLAPSPS